MENYQKLEKVGEGMFTFPRPPRARLAPPSLTHM